MNSKIKLYRTKTGLSQQEIAEKLFISQNTYSKYEKNPSQFSIEQLQQLASLFKVEVEDLINDTPLSQQSSYGSGVALFFSATVSRSGRCVVFLSNRLTGVALRCFSQQPSHGSGRCVVFLSNRLTGVDVAYDNYFS